MLTATHVTRRFGPRIAVDDISFALAPGQILALLGPNGAGKTTTLRMLAGLIEPSSGSVELDGAPIARDTAALRRRVGFLTETPGLWDRLTVRQNLQVHARLHGLAAPRRAVDRALALFEIDKRAADPAAQLSKGLKQRVALARTLLHDPDIVLLDEPTSGLDPESARDVRTLIVRLRGEGRAVLLSTHNLDEVDRLADRVAVLRTALVAVDTPDALRHRLFGARVRIVVNGAPQDFADTLRAVGARSVAIEGPAVIVGLDDGVAVPALVRALVQAGADIESVTREEPSLEAVYLRLIEGAGARINVTSSSPPSSSAAPRVGP